MGPSKGQYQASYLRGHVTKCLDCMLYWTKEKYIGKGKGKELESVVTFKIGSKEVETWENLNLGGTQGLYIVPWLRQPSLLMVSYRPEFWGLSKVMPMDGNFLINKQMPKKCPQQYAWPWILLTNWSAEQLWVLFIYFGENGATVVAIFFIKISCMNI